MECSCNKTTHILFEADFADPIWCADCNMNLELDDFPVSAALRLRVARWTEDYGKWLDWERDKLLSVAIQQELHDCTITYRPSRLSSLYK